MLGRRVAVLHAGRLSAGRRELTLDAGALPAGLYVVRATVRADGGVVRGFTRCVSVVR